MMKRKLACFGLAFALAELFAAYVPSLVLLPAAALFGLLFYWNRHQDLRYPLLGMLLGLGVFVLYSACVVAPIQKLAGQQAYCTAVVEPDAEPSYRDGYLRGTLQIVQLNGKPASFRVNCAAFPADTPGEVFSADFSLLELEDNSYSTSYKSSGVYLQAEYQGNYTAKGDSSSLRFALLRLRRKLANLLQQWMPSEEGNLEAAMLLGNKDALQAPIQDAFRQAGVSHLLAVSGLHVALLCGIFSMGRRRRFLRPLILLRAFFVVFYMFLTGLPVSVLRAGLVFLLALAGDFFWQPVDLLTSTGVAAFLLGIQNAFAPCDIGFQLSFCAVLGVQAASRLVKWEEKHFPVGKSPAALRFRSVILFGAESVQVAFFAGVATTPVLLAHGLTTSGVSVLTNLLVVWMLQPALVLGILILFLSVVPVLAPVLRMVSLLLSLWLHCMIAIVNWCAALPIARIDLPVRYSLYVFCVLAMLAAGFWYIKKFIWYLPAAAICTIGAIGFGILAQRDVVHVAMVGAANNPCVVCIQNDKALILFRGGQSNLQALESYLSDRADPDILSFVDLRQNPSELNFGNYSVERIEECPSYSTQSVLDDLTLDLYHEKSGNLAVIGIADYHIAVMTGNIQLSYPIEVDTLCAAGALSDSVQAQRILTCTDTPAWVSKTGNSTVLYSSDIPVITIRPGISVIYEEVEPLALQ